MRAEPIFSQEWEAQSGVTGDKGVNPVLKSFSCLHGMSVRSYEMNTFYEAFSRFHYPQRLR